MLMFGGKPMFRDAKEGLNGDFDAGLFARFANGAVFEQLEVIKLPAKDAPAACFRRKEPKGEQNAAMRIDQKHTNADAGDGNGLSGGA